jgi:hypothetical protein
MGIFEPFRAIGYITTGGVPFSLQRLGTETFVTISVGKAFHVYNVSHHHHPAPPSSPLPAAAAANCTSLFLQGARRSSFSLSVIREHTKSSAVVAYYALSSCGV